MQCEFDALEARRAMDAAKRAMGNKGTIDILNTVLFSTNGPVATITATDMDMQVSASFDVAGDGGADICLDAAQFGAFLSRATGKVTMKSGDDASRVSLSAGRNRALVPCLDASAFPLMDVPIGDSTRIDGACLSDMMTSTMPHVFPNLARGALAGVNINGTHMQASDGWTAYRVPLALPAIAATVPIRAASAIAAIASGHDATVSCDGRKLAIACGDDVTLITKLLDGQFPDLGRIFPLYNTHDSFTVDRAELIAAAQAAIAAGTDNKSGLICTALKLDGADLVLVRDKDVPKGGEFEASVALINTRADGELTVLIDAVKLVRCLKSHSTETVIISLPDNASPILIEGKGSDAQAVLMPLRG